MTRSAKAGAIVKGIAVAMLVLALGGGGLTQASAATRKPHPHPRPLYWGAWIGKQLTGSEPPWDMSGVSAFERVVGKGLSLVAFSSPFADCSKSPCSFYKFPSPAMQNVRAYGAIPILSWSSASSPWVPGIPDQPEFQLSDLIAGRYDSYISSFAREAREWGHPFFLRFDWEMNGDWFPWSEGVNGNVPGEFVAAWRHVHDLFTADGATNATWVWCPYADANKRRYSNVRPLYPGDEYVDWTCMDGYNWGATPVNSHPWRSFAEIFDRTYGLVKKAAPRKPILIGEMASGSAGGHKALWVRNMFAKLPSRYRRVRGVVWFDGFDRGIDWPIETSLSVTRAFSKGIRRPLYRANVFRELTTAPIPPPK